MLLPLSYLGSSTGEASRRPLAEGSLHILLILNYYRTCISVDYVKDKSDNSSSKALLKEETYFAENPFCKALENARDIECMTICIADLFCLIEDLVIFSNA